GLDQRGLTVKRDERVPAKPREPQERQDDVAQQRLAREERDDLVGSGHAQMEAPAARHARDVLVEERDGSAIGPELAGDQVEERRPPRPVGADDETPLAGLDRQAHVRGDAEPAERLLELPNGQRAQRTLLARSPAISSPL